MATQTSLRALWRKPITQAAVVALIVAMAIWLRLIALDRLPPGLYRDEAFNGLDALQVIEGARPLFFEANNGREPLFIYLLAGSVRAWGRSPGALRLVSALTGVIAVLAIYGLGRICFDRGLAALAALQAATSVWMLNLSRVAFRTMTLVPVAALFLALLWRGLRRRRIADMAGAGLLFGLSLYTYLAARFGVAAVLFIMLYISLVRREGLWIVGWAACAGCAALVASPLLVYFAGHWSAMLDRAAQVSIFSPTIHGGDPWGLLVGNIWRTALGFAVRGDFIPRHNVPLRPIFHPLISPAFVVGLGIALSRARRDTRWGLCLIWLGTLLLPTILAEDAPHMLRAVGILPVLFLFPALGLLEGTRWLSARGLARAAPIIVMLLLLISTADGLAAYLRHLRSETAYYQFEAGATEMALDINRFLGVGWQGAGLLAPEGEAMAGRQVRLARRLWRGWPSLRYLCPAAEALQVLPRDQQIEPSPLDADLLLVLWPFERNDQALQLLPIGRLITAEAGAYERGDLESESRLLYYKLMTCPPGALARDSLATWEHNIRLTGYELEQLSDSALAVTLYWQAGEALAYDYTVFCHVLCQGARVGQHDGLPAQGFYGTGAWRAGDLVEDRHIVPLSIAYDRDSCQVRVGLYDYQTLERLSLLDGHGAPGQVTSMDLH